MHGPSHAHSHSPLPSAGSEAERRASMRALKATLALTLAFMVVEVVGGFVSGSLALLADAAHMLSDNLSLGLALFAVWLAGRPAGPTRTFGYRRAEILAALGNGIALVVISVWIFAEAVDRLASATPPEVEGGLMLTVAALGLGVNVVAALILSRHSAASLNVAAAFRHVLADLIGSVGVIVAAVVILTSGWEEADPLAGIVVALLVLASSWSILRDSVQILLEGSPRGLDVAEVGTAMAALDGVEEVHDLHVWTITSGFPALAAHVLVGRNTDCHATRRRLEELLHDRFGLDHTTLQVDHLGGELLQVEVGPGDDRGSLR